MQFLIMLVIMIITDFLRPVPKPPRKPGLGDFTMPTAEQDRRIPVFWGKPWLHGANLVWYGDLKITKIQVKVKGMFKSKKQTIGYRYFIGLHMVFGHGDDSVRLLEIRVKDDQMWKGDMGAGDGQIDKYSVWGGDEAEGGMQGTFTFMPGGRTQGQNSYLKRNLGAQVPAFRGVASITWNQGYHGVKTVLDAWSVQMQRLPAHLQSGYSSIGGEANPAEVQYECLTNQLWGMGLTADEIDVAAFRACAKTLYDEGMGFSMVWDNAKTMEEILKEVDRHVESVTYQDPMTGLWTMRLVREDYQTSSLPKVNPSNAQLLKFSRPTADELVNEVKVIYASEEFQGKAIPVQVQDLAAFQNRDNQKISSESNYPGFTKESLAKAVAARDLRSLSYPFARVQLKVNRSFYNLRPVDRILFDWPPLGITGMPLIVMERDIGLLTDGTISLTCVQDVFGVGEAVYTESQSSGWVPISRAPIPPESYRMEFTPYWFLLQDDDVGSPESAVPMLMVEAPSAASMGYELSYTDPSLGNSYVAAPDTQPFTPTAILAYDYLETEGTDTSGTLILRDLNGADQPPTATLDALRDLGDSLVVVNNEWMGLGSAVARSDGTYAVTTVRRGLLDSTIARHTAGSKVWFVSLGVGRTPTQLQPFAAGTYRARVMTVALGGVLPEVSAPTLSVTTDGEGNNARPLYAYPVRNLALNGSKVPGKVEGTTLTLTWSHSNKVAENRIQLHSDQAPAKPDGTHYKAYLYTAAGQLRAESDEITGTMHSFTSAEVPGGLPSAGYVQVATVNQYGSSPRATLWFGRSVDYLATQDAGPQLLLEEAGPWTFLRMAD